MTDEMKKHLLEKVEATLGPGERPFTVHCPHDPIPAGEGVAIAVFSTTMWNEIVRAYAERLTSEAQQAGSR
jgi:hypothetical protein